MSKKDDFKEFVSRNPSLINKVKSGEATWQKYYEIYDLYGEDSNTWDTYLKEESKEERNINLGELTKLVKNINMNSVQKYVGTAQKAVNLIQELTTKGTAAGGAAEIAKNIKTPVAERPLNKFFED